VIWREKRILLIVLGVLLAANTIFFFTYRVQYQSRLDELDERRSAAESELERARAGRIEAERQVRAYRQIEKDVQTVFTEHWSTQTARLTPLIAEVKRLAVASSMIPASYGFDRAEAALEAGRGRTKNVGATQVGISFAVEGTYPQVRRLINLLELSRQFVIVDQVALGSRDGDHLILKLHLTTLFREDGPGDRL
jgi:Tfp pilus assembly protein PilO